MEFKSLLLVALAVVCVICEDVPAPANNPPSDHIEGNRKPNDKLLHSQAIYVHSGVLQRVSTEVEFPQGQPLNGNITMLSILNRKTPGEITNIRGGAGDTRISFKLTSKRGHSLHYDFTVYGYQN